MRLECQCKQILELPQVSFPCPLTAFSHFYVVCTASNGKLVGGLGMGNCRIEVMLL